MEELDVHTHNRFSSQYSAFCILHSVFSVLYFLIRILYSVLYSVFYIQYSVYSIICYVFQFQYSVFCSYSEQSSRKKPLLLGDNEQGDPPKPHGIYLTALTLLEK